MGCEERGVMSMDTVGGLRMGLSVSCFVCCVSWLMYVHTGKSISPRFWMDWILPCFV